MGVETAIVIGALAAGYTINETERAKKAQKKERKKAEEQQASMEAAMAAQEKRAANDLRRDQTRAFQQGKQAEANGRASTILTSNTLGGISDNAGTATSMGGGKTLLGM